MSGRDLNAHRNCFYKEVNRQNVIIVGPFVAPLGIITCYLVLREENLVSELCTGHLSCNINELLKAKGNSI